MAGGAPSADLLRQGVASLSKLTALVGITDMDTSLKALLERTMRMVGAGLGFVILANDSELSPVVARHGSSKRPMNGSAGPSVRRSFVPGLRCCWRGHRSSRRAISRALL